MALRCQVKGVVQGVGFRPFVYRLACRHAIYGWVRNDQNGVLLHVEGPASNVQAFLAELVASPPPAAAVVGVETRNAVFAGYDRFDIMDSNAAGAPSTRISPDLRICNDCRHELLMPSDRRFHYPYINCTNCGPRYSIITALPYDRSRTTMAPWPMCPACGSEYHAPASRRFHAQPNSCPACGPAYRLFYAGETKARNRGAVRECARMLAAGAIVAIKGLGGYHLACDALDQMAVEALRERKFRKEKPFALMAKNPDVAQRYARITPAERAALDSPAAPIVLLERRRSSLPVAEGVAPGAFELGIMLPYTPLHVLLFEEGAPELIVLTSANRSDEPIAYDDDDALERLAGIADAFLIGERPIARRIDDSLVRVTPRGIQQLRRARGYAPAVVAQLPVARPILAVGADLKNTVALVVGGETLVSPHIGDLEHHGVRCAHERAIADLTAMYHLTPEDLLVVHDLHPGYHSTRCALDCPGEKIAVQHHRAHIASVLAERGAWTSRVIGVAFDGSGYGDDGTIWGGEFFAGSLAGGLERVGFLQPAWLPGGDAAARRPVQAAAGFLFDLAERYDFSRAPFSFPPLFRQSMSLIEKQMRTYRTTSIGRLFDTVAALLGFSRPMTYEGQAAVWLENLARTSDAGGVYPFPHFDHAPLLESIVRDRLANKPAPDIARTFIRSLARQTVDEGFRLRREYDASALVLSGGVFQNTLLLADIIAYAARSPRTLEVWYNLDVPPNDGGISAGQAALAAASLQQGCSNDHP